MFRRKGQADQPASVPAHEVDDFRGGELRSTDEVALVLPVLVIHEYDHTAGGEPV